MGASEPVCSRVRQLPDHGHVEPDVDDGGFESANRRSSDRGTGVVSTERLNELLQAGVELELSTIPPYLCALYSIRPGGNEEAKLVIRSVVVEEMLHMVLAANVLNAVGGEPRVTGENAPRYPHELPSDVVLHLLPFSPEVVD